MSARAARGDIVMLEARYLGTVARSYLHVTALDKFVVTRTDRSTGRLALYLRKVGREDMVIVAWPEQVRIVHRQNPQAPRARRGGARA